ncbi:MAG: ABC transporter ATP-binding protein [Lachnospiraceae bacterium]
MKQIHIKPIHNPNHMSSYWIAEWLSLLGVTIFGLLFDGSMSIGPILQGYLIDTIIKEAPLKLVLLQALIFIATILLIQLARTLKRYFVRLFANHTSASMRRMLYHNIMNLDIKELAAESTGDLMNKAVADVDICVEGMRKVTTEFFDTGILMTSYLISLCLYDIKITLLSCAFIPITMCLAEFFKKIIVKYNIAARTQSSLVSELTYDTIDHAMLYRINGIEDANRSVYRHELENLTHKSIQANILENSMQPIYNAISLIGIAAIFCLGGRKVIDEVWSIGMFTSYLVLFTALTTKSSKAAKLFNSFQKASVSWKRIKPYLIPYPVPDSKELPVFTESGLSVSHLRFAYPDTTTLLLDDISLHAAPGEMIGITGAVACGKSTLAIALSGLYAYHGSILLNGIELSAYTQTQRSALISYMGHAPFLLSDTIYENITLGDAGDISQVLEDVCFTADLLTMPDGIYTKVGNHGVRLSGGQQARIALARALYHNSLLLILDDPFSAVDKDTEASMIQNLRTHYTDRIILLLSHRLFAFAQTDHVLFLTDTHTGIQGTHDELLRLCPEYKTLYQLQNGGEQDEN